MAKVEGDIYIERPPEVVFDFVADERNEPRYNARMTAVSLLSDPPIGRGARFARDLDEPEGVSGDQGPVGLCEELSRRG